VTKPGIGIGMAERTLVIECATPALSLALLEKGAVIASYHVEIGRGHAEALLPAIAALPQEGRCAGIMVDTGPGSFTGVRVGLAAARALAFAWNVPVFGYGCLDLVAAMVRATHAPADPFLVTMIGGHGELFWQRFAPLPEDDDGRIPISTPIETLAPQIDDQVIYGSGADILISARGRGGIARPLLPDARCATLLLPSRINAHASAQYGRGADAQPMRDRTT
jgi:tRNA threonylcarbamoyladenosine biosynthesis protein TsaB